jgi:hypothetical protein
MKTTLEEALNIAEGLKEFGQVKKCKDTTMSYRLAKLRKTLQGEMEILNETRKAWLEELATGKDERGNPTIDPGTPQHEEIQKRLKKLMKEPVDLYWIPADYDKFNPKNELGLSEDFVFLTFQMWLDPEDKPKEEPKPPEEP